MGEQFKLPRLAKCLRPIIIAYSNNKVNFAPRYFLLIFYCFLSYRTLEHFQLQSRRLHEDSLSLSVEPREQCRGQKTV